MGKKWNNQPQENSQFSIPISGSELSLRSVDS